VLPRPFVFLQNGQAILLLSVGGLETGNFLLEGSIDIVEGLKFGICLYLIRRALEKDREERCRTHL